MRVAVVYPGLREDHMTEHKWTIEESAESDEWHGHWFTIKDEQGNEWMSLMNPEEDVKKLVSLLEIAQAVAASQIAVVQVPRRFDGSPPAQENMLSNSSTDLHAIRRLAIDLLSREATK